MQNKSEKTEEHERARYNAFSNTIHLHNVDSLSLELVKEKSERDFMMALYGSGYGKLPMSSFNNSQRYLINNRIAELAHAKQNIKDGAIRM